MTKPHLNVSIIIIAHSASTFAKELNVSDEFTQ